jgi:hypothetical protein
VVKRIDVPGYAAGENNILTNTQTGKAARFGTPEWVRLNRAAESAGKTPDNFHTTSTGVVKKNDPFPWAGLALAAAPVAIPAVLGALGVGAGAGAALPSAAGTSVLDATALAGVTPASVGAGSGAGMLGLKTADWIDLALGGMSLFGGGDEAQKRKSFEGTSADPIQMLTQNMDAIKTLAGAISDRSAQRMSRTRDGVPGPVSIAGLPFQIGGGLGADPAARVPSLMGMPDPFAMMQGIGPGVQQPKPANPGVRQKGPK